ncbi:MAG TPA: twin-arginine translocase subunit TatC, partial [Porticoccaceae bacterium]|nr:twin-arginine translocase subunit TatC [Porticoccaceae bacterium]
ISQTLLALPMWFLYEVGLFFGRLIYREGSLDADSEATEQNTDNPAQDQSR